MAKLDELLCSAPAISDFAAPEPDNALDWAIFALSKNIQPALAMSATEGHRAPWRGRMWAMQTQQAVHTAESGERNKTFPVQQKNQMPGWDTGYPPPTLQSSVPSLYLPPRCNTDSHSRQRSPQSSTRISPAAISLHSTWRIAPGKGLSRSCSLCLTDSKASHRLTCCGETQGLNLLD